jgi:hypothetical protein
MRTATPFDAARSVVLRGSGDARYTGRPTSARRAAQAALAASDALAADRSAKGLYECCGAEKPVGSTSKTCKSCQRAAFGGL